MWIFIVIKLTSFLYKQHNTPPPPPTNPQNTKNDGNIKSIIFNKWKHKQLGNKTLFAPITIHLILSNTHI